MNGRRTLPGLLLSLIFVYLILWKPHPGAVFDGRMPVLQGFFGDPRLDYGMLWQVLRRISFLPLAVSFLLNPVQILIRSNRWAVMVRPLGRLRLIDSCGLQMVGYFAGAVLPLRVGEVIRGVLLGRRIGVPSSSSLAAVVTERVLDLITLLVLIAIVGLLFPFPEAINRTATWMGVGALFAVAGVLYLSLTPEPLKGTLGWLKRHFPDRLGEGLAGGLARFFAGFVLPGDLRSHLTVGFQTVVLWLTYALQGYLVLVAFGFDRDYPLIAASPLLASFVVLALNSIGIAIPSAPGGVGSFHAVSAFGLTLLGVPAEPAVGFALVIHAISFLFYVGVGVPFVWREGLHLTELGRTGRLRKPPQPEEATP